jgi:hypothetical protein
MNDGTGRTKEGPMRIAARRFGVALGLALPLAAAAVQAQSKQAQQYKAGPGQIVERCGIAGTFTVGRTFVGSADRFRRTGDNQFTAPDGTTVVTNAQRQIVEIKIATPGVFTQRYAVIGDIRLNEVLKRYGQPQPRSRPRKPADPHDFVLEYAYEGVSFLFTGMPTGMSVRRGAYVAAPLDKPVAAVIVHEKERDPAGADHACNLASSK